MMLKQVIGLGVEMGGQMHEGMDGDRYLSLRQKDLL